MNVTTWHNDINRTGQQLYETALTPSAVGAAGAFGWLWEYSVQGQVYAQPLAVQLPNCTGSPCSLVYIATEQDMLYGFDANSSTQVWSANIATNGSPVDCRNFALLRQCIPTDPLYPYIGVTGTPVIDRDAGILYVVTAIIPNGTGSDNVRQYLHAINIRTGQEAASNSPIEVTGTVIGTAPTTGDCTTSIPRGAGTVSFDPTHHLQRAGLLLLPVNGQNVLYVAFTPIIGETQNGWIFGYRYNTSSGFTKVATFVTTPNGTGGGIWESGAGLAAEIRNDGSKYIYVATGNGTFDINIQPTPSTDYGDSLIKLAVDNTSGALTVANYFTPSDVFTYHTPNGDGRCEYGNDEDFGSGGPMIFPEAFYYDPNQQKYLNLAVSADKESSTYVVDRDNLGGYTAPPGTDHIVQEITLPPNPQWDAQKQSYYSNPAYWKYVNGGTTQRWLYYSAQIRKDTTPLPLYMYPLSIGAPGPILTTGSKATGTKFCTHGATPSISASQNTGGILWAIERVNAHLQQDCNSDTWLPAVLHAYNATDVSTPQNGLYTSNGNPNIAGLAAKFSTPTIFNGRVYMGTLGLPSDYGTTGEVDVFGLCGNPSQCH